ncbi:acyl carrier protein [Plebeiibacterium sediminum]|uniref:Phosphopantetheine-binding protein n=1 Tax=Plebeiibacterium sediminum TaxID=2992112 RepID=A0AAE3M330_9BACT|nr:phosphopantetheine-binding protein [Plebeiobacterium sediminum]MCW3786224.1 phosphopantetheine-binding protein [Plebeiobacterium sediminum]
MKEKIRSFIAEITFNDSSLIKDDTMIFDEGIFDSMGLLGLINFIESEFNVLAEDSDLQEENFGSVERIVAFIEKKQTQAA